MARRNHSPCHILVSVDKYWGHRNKKHKKQPFADASASLLPLVLWHVWFQAGAWISHTTPLTPPSCEVGGIAKRIKNRSPSAKNPVWRDTSRPPTILILYWLSIICRGREVSRPYHAKSFGRFDATSFQEIMLSSGGLRETNWYQRQKSHSP